MVPRRSSTWILALLGLLACDTASEPEPSRVPDEGERGRAIGGRVVSGLEPVPGAVLVVQPSAFFPSDVRFDGGSPEALTSVTDSSGRYTFGFGPLRYDMLVRAGTDLTVFRGLGYRVLEPSIAAPVAPRAWRAQLEPALPPPPEGRDVAFFVSGSEAVGLEQRGALLDVSFRTFSTTVTVHAVEYPKEAGLAAAVAYGRADVRVHSGGVSPFSIALAPITAPPLETRLRATAPEQMDLELAEVFVDLGLRTSARSVAKVAVGAPLRVAPVPNARWAVRLRARGRGGVSDSGLRVFDPAATEVDLELPAPPVLESPANGSAIARDTPLYVFAAEGIREHVLTPLDGQGGEIRVVTAARDAMRPDGAVVGLPPPVGRYAWTVQVWPELGFVDQVSGSETRVIVPSATCAPYVLVLR